MAPARLRTCLDKLLRVSWPIFLMSQPKTVACAAARQRPECVMCFLGGLVQNLKVAELENHLDEKQPCLHSICIAQMVAEMIASLELAHAGYRH
jgi:hypothetical protein